MYNEHQNQCFQDHEQLLNYAQEDDIMGCEDQDMEDVFDDCNMAPGQGMIAPENVQTAQQKQEEVTYLESSRTISETYTQNDGSSRKVQLPSREDSENTI